jgi:hypothetical protein
MENEQLIPVEQFCGHFHIEFSFIRSLSEYGLVEITRLDEVEYVKKEQIKELEKMIRLYYDLDINIEGIAAISQLLQRVDHLQGELNALKNRLRLYENE